MKTKMIWCLLGINITLVVSAILPSIRQTSAMAQRALDRPADYLMIPGRVAGSDNGVVYILNETDGLLGAMAFQDKGGLSIMPPMELSRVFSEEAFEDNPRRR